MTDQTDYPSRLERGAEGSSLESPAQFYESLVVIWPLCRTRREQELLSTASQRVAYSHCTADEQDAIMSLRERAGLIR